MSNVPLTFKSLIPYQILQFLIIIVWSFIANATADQWLVISHESLVEWLSSASLVMGTLIVILVLLSWWMKQQVKFQEPIWNIHDQEVTMSEYERMYRDYVKGYSQFIVRVDFPTLTFLALFVATAYLLPPLVLFNPLLLSLPSFIFGFLVILIGVSSASFSFKIIPNKASKHFSVVPPAPLRMTLKMLWDVLGASWIGISVKISEAEGYYTLNDPRPVLRIEGIEGAARIFLSLDDDHRPCAVSIESTLEIHSEPIEISVDSTEKEIVQVVEQAVKIVLETYVESHEYDDLLDEVLEELGISLPTKGNHNENETLDTSEVSE